MGKVFDQNEANRHLIGASRYLLTLRSSVDLQHERDTKKDEAGITHDVTWV